MVISETEVSGAMVVGDICHIHAASNEGPRANPEISEQERDNPSNLLLLCPTHHRIVDGQHETYPPDLLRSWKVKQEREHRAAISKNIIAIGHAELEVAAKALMNFSAGVSQSLLLIPPEEKIKKNGLGTASAELLRIGTAKSQEVSDMLSRAIQLDQEFPDRLRNGFVTKYLELKSDGVKGDALFSEMYQWAGNNGGDDRKAAGLCVLSHLFMICDVFEK